MGSFAGACGSLAGCRRNVFRRMQNNRLSKGKTSSFFIHAMSAVKNFLCPPASDLAFMVAVLVL
jgi:hypothetical protein